jgi:hypothetical protein
MKNLEEYWIEINRLENPATRAPQTPRQAVQRRVRRARGAEAQGSRGRAGGRGDAFEHVANTVETIAVKES